MQEAVELRMCVTVQIGYRIMLLYWGTLYFMTWCYNKANFYKFLIICVMQNSRGIEYKNTIK